MRGAAVDPSREGPPNRGDLHRFIYVNRRDRDRGAADCCMPRQSARP